MDPAKSKPDEMAIDIPARDGTLLHITLRRDDDGAFGEKSQVEVQEHTAHGLRPLTTFTAIAIQGAAAWSPLRRGGLQIHDQVPGLTIESHWLTTLTDWLLMAAETDIDVWSRNT